LVAFRAFIGVLGILGAVAAAQQSLEFDVSSIKPNVSGELGGDTRRLPDGTYTATNISILNLLPLAWPAEGFEYRNLPDWARRDRYDVTVKPPPGASPAQIQEMWRTLFKHRLKLEARNEVREGPIYALVLARADGRLGPQLKTSPHDCAALAAAASAAPVVSGPTPPSAEEVMATCGSLFLPGRVFIGGTLLSTFARSLSSSVGRIVEDRTGLQGYYALTLTTTVIPRPGADAAPDAGAAPSIFTALEEQLGLKLEPATKLLQTVVIDHIEPPTEN
jgi:uncharacterized protein (TIGR03435 family)